MRPHAVGIEVDGRLEAQVAVGEQSSLELAKAIADALDLVQERAALRGNR